MNYVNILIFAAVGLWAAPVTFAQSPHGPPASEQLVSLYVQGERLQISQDFKVRLDNRRLRVALANRGVIATDAADELVIALIQPMRKVQQVKVRADQLVVFDDVSDGISSLLVMGTENAVRARSVTYAAFAFFAESGALRRQAVAGEELQELEVPVALVNTDRVRQELPKVSTKVNFDELTSPDVYDPQPRTHFRVRQTAAGGLVGKLAVPESPLSSLPGEIQVIILRNDAEYARVTTGLDGIFRVTSIEPGFYSLFAVGSNGHAALSFELVANDQDTRLWQIRGHGVNRFVQAQANVAPRLEVLLIPPSLMDQVVSLVQAQYGPPRQDNSDGQVAGAAGTNVDSRNANGSTNPLVGQVSGSGRGFSGAGGAGGGSMNAGGSSAAIGGLAGLAALAAGLAATSNDDNEFEANIVTPVNVIPINVTPTNVTPISP